jgi:hypothetical protein
MTTEIEAVEYFKGLSYTGQREFYGKLAKWQKMPDYTLGFQLDSKGIALLTRAVNFCAELEICYRAEKVDNTKVKLIFEGAGNRNKVLIGIMGVRTNTNTEKEEENGCLSLY